MSKKSKDDSSSEAPLTKKSEATKKKSGQSSGRGLGRGLGDLLSQHDTDLPFLSAYGGASGEHEAGLPASAGEMNQGELLKAIERHLKTSLPTEKVVMGEGVIDVEGNWLRVEVSNKGGVTIDVSSKDSTLPLVPSDLQSPGFIEGKITKDRCSVTVRMLEWGIESRRFFNRLCEYHLLIK